jgi:hypothetical protein
MIKNLAAIFLFGERMLTECYAITRLQAEGDGILSTMLTDLILNPRYFDLV